ncbi:MAG: terpene cyclase/mutase family protein [Gammaproteobacteria bacterium]|jgi:hypothetical protein
MTNLLEDIESAVYRGLGFILAQQDTEGSWTDWELPPGASSEWTTAYIGFRLSGLHTPFRQRISEPLDRAACWLLAHRFPNGGWGYNPTVESDADSTALAMIFLTSTHHEPPDDAYDYLRRFQQQDGGFSTFLQDGLMGSWGRSHAEITPVALLALQTHRGGLPDEILTRGLNWIHRMRRANGTWNSFWWSTPLPATEANLALLAALECPADMPPILQDREPDDNLQTAYLLSITAYAESDQRMYDLARFLINAQGQDGSWQSGPALRIPQRNCERPRGQLLSGPSFADPMRLFTTATVISALSKAHWIIVSKSRESYDSDQYMRTHRSVY